MWKSVCGVEIYPAFCKSLSRRYVGTSGIDEPPDGRKTVREGRCRKLERDKESDVVVLDMVEYGVYFRSSCALLIDGICCCMPIEQRLVSTAAG